MPIRPVKAELAAHWLVRWEAERDAADEALQRRLAEGEPATKAAARKPRRAA